MQTMTITIEKSRNISLLTAILLLLATPCLAAGSVEISFSDVTGLLSYEHTITNAEDNNSKLNGRFMRNTEENTSLGSVGFDVHAPIAGVDGLQLGGGVKVYAATYQNQDIVSAAMGVLADYFPPALGGFGLSGDIYYGPKVFTGQDADWLLESNARVAYRLSPFAEFFVAYNNIRADMEHRGTRSLNEIGRIGMVFSF